MKWIAYLFVAGIGVLAAWRYIEKNRYAVKVPLDELRVTRSPTPVVK